MTRLDIAKEMDSFIDQAYLIAKNREFGKNVVRVYYTGGTLCIDVLIMAKKTLEYVIMCNISNETFTIVDNNGKESVEIRGLLSIKSLKKLFEIYFILNGSKTDYYNECFENSCIRHLQ